MGPVSAAEVLARFRLTGAPGKGPMGKEHQEPVLRPAGVAQAGALAAGLSFPPRFLPILPCQSRVLRSLPLRE